MKTNQLKSDSKELYAYFRSRVNQKVLAIDVMKAFGYSPRHIRKCVEFLRPFLKGATICSGDYGYVLTNDKDMIHRAYTRYSNMGVSMLRTAKNLGNTLNALHNANQITLEL